MGNHHSHSHGGTSKKGSLTSDTADSIHKNELSRSSSGTDVQDNFQPQAVMSPVDKLAKILCEKSSEEEGINGIGLGTFTRYLFPRYQVLAEKLYNYFHRNVNTTKSYIPTNDFRSQCELFLAIIDDNSAIDLIVKMYSVYREDSDNEFMTPESLRSLLMTSYHIAMDHYSEGPQMCLVINKTLKAVVDSCFHSKTHLSMQFVSHWLAANTPRLLLPIHRYAVHCLATSYRTLEADGPPLAAGLELTTPVLEQPNPFGSKVPHPHLLQMSMSWLLAGALGPIYSRPPHPHLLETELLAGALGPIYSRPRKPNSPGNSGTGLSSMSFLTKLLFAVPSHWLILYDSNEMGLAANRFLHHVLAYKGPTLILIKANDDSLFCVASPCEWKESHLYWGGEDCAVVQLLPKFQMLEKGSKMLYLNTTVRGYPQGLRAGSDPRAPIIAIDGGFEKFEFRKIPYSISCIEVWGCGDQANREAQLDVKKWQSLLLRKQMWIIFYILYFKGMKR
ncbi:tld [Popillia japonica]|uniref:Tld n=1 Tax=Popillia japonica TaxID=7064 RepID=A0AAW1N424_POPJA